MISDEKKSSIVNTLELMSYLLFSIAIILIPLNMVPWSNVLGELGEKGSLFPFYLIIPFTFIIILITKKYYKIKDRSMYTYLAFLAVTVISIIANLNNIIHNTFKGRTGIEKLILQFIVVVLVSLIIYTAYYILVANNIKFEKFRKLILISFVACGIYSFFEVLTLYGVFDFSPVTNFISNIVHKYTRGEVYYRGVRSLSGEASFFGMYVSFCLPWILSYVFTEKKNAKYILIFMYLLVLSLLTKSRFALAVVYLQLFLFIILYLANMKTTKPKGKIVYRFIIGIIVVVVLTGSMYAKVGHDKNGNSANSVSISQLISSLKDPNNYSNIARLGLMKGSINMGLDNPIFGVGLGQYGFNIDKYLDDNARISYEVQNWISTESQDWPPAFSLHLRILAEQGIVGFALWCILWISVFTRTYKKWKSKTDDYEGICLIISMIGVIISGFNIDSYAYFPYYIVLALSFVYLEEDKNIVYTLKK